LAGRSSVTSLGALSARGALSCRACPFTITADSSRLRPAAGSCRSASAGSCCAAWYLSGPAAGPTTVLLTLLPSRRPSCGLLLGPSSGTESDLRRSRAAAAAALPAPGPDTRPLP
jgi:hypothetical protein